MLYTVGVKRPLGLGWKKYRVRGHRWDQGRLILDLSNDFQLHIPGVKIRAFRVYPDIRHILKTMEENKRRQADLEERARREHEAWLHEQQRMRHPTSRFADEEIGELPAIAEPAEPTPYQLAQERAHVRVRGILQSNGQQPQAEA